MYVLGIDDGWNGTACLLKDGAIIACASEERFSRIKNHGGFPIRAVRWMLTYAGITSRDLDCISLFTQGIIPINLPSTGNARAAGSLKKIYNAAWIPRNLWRSVEYGIPQLRSVGAFSHKAAFGVNSLLSNRIRLRQIAANLDVEEERILKVEHHLCHAYAAYYGNPQRSQKMLVITLDGEGDGLCGTVCVDNDGEMRRIGQTDMEHSLGYLYGEVTRYLGMKPNEHEFKVMGLAPYCSKYEMKKTLPLFTKLISLDEDNGLQLRSAVRSTLFSRYLKTNLVGHRFDAIAASVQKLTEDLTTGLVANAVKTTGNRRVVLGGGIFMNVKANMRIMYMPELEDLFVFPSCGDESCCIGAAYYGYIEWCRRNQQPRVVEPIRDLYLGPDYSDQDIETYIKKNNLQNKYHIEWVPKIEKRVAQLLRDGKVVARFNGRMEWGARSLGNRSILAHPSEPDIIKIINTQIKGRDFWMPFAPSILKEREHDYIVNPKKISAPYMIMAFESTELARKELRAAMHPYDMTIRPQIVEEAWNPSFHATIKEFEELTGIGAVLNTSFNLHGEPIVCSPADAVHVFEHSALEYLAIGHCLISK